MDASPEVARHVRLRRPRTVIVEEILGTLSESTSVAGDNPLVPHAGEARFSGILGRCWELLTVRIRTSVRSSVPAAGQLDSKPRTPNPTRSRKAAL